MFNDLAKNGPSGVSPQNTSASYGASAFSQFSDQERSELETAAYRIGKSITRIGKGFFNWLYPKEKSSHAPSISELRRAHVKAFSDAFRHRPVGASHKIAEMVREKFRHLAPALKTPEEIDETRAAFLAVIKRECRRTLDLKEMLELLPEFNEKILPSPVPKENNAKLKELLSQVKHEFQKRLFELGDKSDDVLAKMGLSRTHSPDGKRFPKALQFDVTGTKMEAQGAAMQFNIELPRARFCPYTALRVAEKFFNGDKKMGIPRDRRHAELYVLQAMLSVNPNEPNEVDAVLKAYDKYNMGEGIRSVQEMIKALRAYKEAYFYYAWLMAKEYRKEFDKSGIQLEESESVSSAPLNEPTSLDDVRALARSGNARASLFIAENYWSEALLAAEPETKKAKAKWAQLFYTQASKQDTSGISDYFAFEFFMSDFWQNFGSDLGKEYTMVRRGFHAKRAKERLSPEDRDVLKEWKRDPGVLDPYLARKLDAEKKEVHGLPVDTDLPPNPLGPDSDVRRAVNLQKAEKNDELVVLLNKNPAILRKVKEAAHNREIAALKVMAVFWEKGQGGEGLLAWISVLELMPDSAQLQEEFLEIGRRVLKGVREGLGETAAPRVNLFIEMMLIVNQHHQYSHPERAKVWDMVVIPEIEQTIEYLKKEKAGLAKNIGKGMWANTQPKAALPQKDVRSNEEEDGPRMEL